MFGVIVGLAIFGAVLALVIMLVVDVWVNRVK